MNPEYTLTNQPSSMQTELAILGTMLSNERNLENCLSLLITEDFYEFKNKYIFNAIIACVKKDRRVDTSTVYEELINDGKKPVFDTPIYLVDCLQSSYPGMDVEGYVEILREKRAHRELLLAGVDLLNEVARPVKNISLTLDRIGQRIFSIAKPALDHDSETLKESALAYLDGVNAREKEFRETGKVTRRGISSGYEDLDKLLDGLRPGNLIVLAARTGVGKTAFAINLAHNVSVKGKIPSLFLSLEMKREELIGRILSIDSGVSSSRMEKGTITELDHSKLEEAINSFESSNLYIRDKCGLTLSDIRGQTRRLIESFGVKLLIVDYLQLILPSHRSDNRQTEVAEISRGLKVLAKDFNIPVICLSQLSRKTEERESKIPILSDLRESGAIEQDSDSVIFLFRPDSYDRMKKPGVMEVIVAKNRHGQIGTIDLKFDGETSKASALCYSAIPNYMDTDN
jgi:replicative DNA helicase